MQGILKLTMRQCCILGYGLGACADIDPKVPLKKAVPIKEVLDRSVNWFIGPKNGNL